MKIAIMQPYFLPYIGYWQLMNAVDIFVVYDEIQFTKKGWIHRNRYLSQGHDAYFTISLKHDSDYLDVCHREISDGFDREKLLRQIRGAYKNAPFFEETFDLFQRILLYDERNLFGFLRYSIETIAKTLDIQTKRVVSSQISGIDPSLHSADRVIALCKACDAAHYINPIGGVTLYSKESFAAQGIVLNFLQSDPIVYPQFDNPFVPSLSILDVLMFNDVETVKGYLSRYKLI